MSTSGWVIKNRDDSKRSEAGSCGKKPVRSDSNGCIFQLPEGKKLIPAMHQGNKPSSCLGNGIDQEASCRSSGHAGTYSGWGSRLRVCWPRRCPKGPSRRWRRARPSFPLPTSRPTSTSVATARFGRMTSAGSTACSPRLTSSFPLVTMACPRLMQVLIGCR